MSNKTAVQNNASQGIGLSGILGIVFIILKLTHVISWAWWLILLPFYIGFILIAGFLLGVSIVIGISFLVKKLFKIR